MLSKLLGSSVVVIGLLLAGVQKGSADQLFYCKNNAITNQPCPLCRQPHLSAKYDRDQY
jgi:hypothetical protein